VKVVASTVDPASTNALIMACSLVRPGLRSPILSVRPTDGHRAGADTSRCHERGAWLLPAW
jgi:hypothetical protein